MNKVKQSQIKDLYTGAIREILDTIGDVDPKASAQYPLGGLVHIAGIGQITVAELEAELVRRTQGEL